MRPPRKGQMVLSGARIVTVAFGLAEQPVPAARPWWFAAIRAAASTSGCLARHADRTSAARARPRSCSACRSPPCLRPFTSVTWTSIRGQTILEPCQPVTHLFFDPLSHVLRSHHRAIGIELELHGHGALLLSEFMLLLMQTVWRGGGGVSTPKCEAFQLSECSISSARAASFGFIGFGSGRLSGAHLFGFRALHCSLARLFGKGPAKSFPIAARARGHCPASPRRRAPPLRRPRSQ